MTATTTETDLEARVRNLVQGALFKEQGNWAHGSPIVDRIMVELGPVIGELAGARTKLAALKAMARELRQAASNSDYGDGRWEVATRILDVIDSGED